MDTQTLIAVVASVVVLLGLVLFLVRRRAPKVPAAHEELPSTGLPPAAEPPRTQDREVVARKAESAAPVAAQPTAPVAPDGLTEEAAAASAPVVSEHEKDVAAIRKGLANTRGGLIARLAKL